MRNDRPFCCAAAIAVAFTAIAPAVRADDALARCVSAAEEAQRLQKKDKLLQARERLALCSDEACPDVIRRDCSRWDESIARDLPHVTFRAIDARGHEVAGARVFVDERVVAERLDGSAVAVNPGEHTVLFVARMGVSREVHTTARAGESAQVSVTFAEELRADGTRELLSAGPPTDVVVEAGLGLAALATFGVFEVLWQKDYRHLRDTCGQSHACTDAEIDPVRTKYVVARVSLAIAGVALGVAAWRFFTTSSRSASVSVTSLRQGARSGIAF